MKSAPTPRKARLLVSTIAVACLAFVCAGPAAANVGSYTTRGAWSFISAPGLHPARELTAGSIHRRSLAPGDFLLDVFPNTSETGPMTGEVGPLILDNQLRPVWFAPVGTGVESADLQQETYARKPVLVWWEGQVTGTGATRSGEVVVVDQHYRRVATLRAKGPWTISLHDAVISGTGIWVTVYRYVRGQNLVPYGGSRNGTVYDAGVQEYDLKTGRLLYTWDALNPGGAAHVPLTASRQSATRGKPWDAYHVNTVQVLPGNQILVSMRNTWAAYLVDVPTGAIVWTLGGKHSSFAFSAGAHFSWQHDVELLGGNEVTLFNDNCCEQLPDGSYVRPPGPAEAMVLKLNLLTHTASRVATYTHNPALTPAYLGSTQLLTNGNALVGWGSKPYFTEYARSGEPLLDAYFPLKDLSYRVLYSASWVGTPYYPPRGAARSVHGKTVVYASWNGATEVRSWRVLAGTSAGHLSPVATAPRNGFETAVAVAHHGYALFEVQARGAGGEVLGTSAAFRAG
jgi:hypothetical protein